MLVYVDVEELDLSRYPCLGAAMWSSQSELVLAVAAKETTRMVTRRRHSGPGSCTHKLATGQKYPSSFDFMQCTVLVTRQMFCGIFPPDRLSADEKLLLEV